MSFGPAHRVRSIPIGIIGAGVFGSINPVTAVALHGLVRLGLVYNLKVLDGSLCVA